MAERGISRIISTTVSYFFDVQRFVKKVMKKGKEVKKSEKKEINYSHDGCPDFVLVGINRM